MMNPLKFWIFVLPVFTLSVLVSCSSNSEDEMIKRLLNQFAPVEITFDESLLDQRQMVVVEKLYEASKIMDEIFLDQVHSQNRSIRENLQRSDQEEILAYFNIMFGPFDRLNHNEPFYGDGKKPLGANFYPEDMSKEEFEDWIRQHPEDKEAFTSEFTMIRRNGEKLVAIPYSEYFEKPLTQAADLLREAAEFADNLSLKRYLLTRAAAFLSNDYYESDMAWMDLKDHTIEVVIGPYEVYEDQLFNYKASFESFVTIKDPAESAKLAVFANYLEDLERNLPIPDAYKNFDRGKESPILVVQEVFGAGDTKAGIQTLAFNLPNDERVREAKGSKKVLLKNLHLAKYEKQLVPIARQVLAEDQQHLVTFDAFFNHTLMHEISHGLGPGTINVDGRETEVKKELKETYSKIEECKADVLGMYNNIFMIRKGVYPEEIKPSIWTTFLAGILRSVRFGINEAHGAGNAIIFNYLLEKGAYEYDDAKQTMNVNTENIEYAVTNLATLVLTIQAKGDYQGARDLLDKYAVASSPMKALVNKLTDIPVDIKPVFQIDNMYNSR